MSDSVSINAESAVSGETGSNVALSSAGVPLAIVPAYKHLQQQRKFQGPISELPELPSHRFQYSVWHDLRSGSLKGTELKAPRVREGPAEKGRAFYLLKDEDNQNIHHSLHGKQRVQHRTTLEDWNAATSASLCYQELHHQYQKDNFYRILGNLKNVEQLYLVDNSITTLASYSFPKCTVLNLNKNFISSFKKLPSIPKITCLTMEDNDVNSFRGLSSLSTLEQLYLRGNPISFVVNYRPKVFKMLPHLQVLDGVSKLEDDDVFVDEEDIPDQEPSRCVIA
ncbi:uncharacterized protein LOC110440536 [Mizuhopecten yessoensis]|uniref:Acidic leucine-rich nuclear phosphoprotein 32 family member A n=1 Tax=Mizuhopecten yessoensis TaxID=6573 RepID=A0A210PL09_MIZYE|nr:uncharacterized protein LOC110440536 [Mizuhopecten yessoensis]OWF37178.1 Acidic leucine-rich nuclear phosphoprotein 32 family member A [Mizuhopecten yessoensis]